MSKPTAFPAERLFPLLSEDWESLNDIHVRVGLAGGSIGTYQIGCLLRRLHDRGLVTHNGHEGDKRLRWRKLRDEERFQCPRLCCR